jgi:hypothetical protein
MPTLTEHFTWADVTRSDTATRLKIDNSAPLSLTPTIKATAAMMERIRAHLTSLRKADTPIIVTSWYRCPALNTAIGSGSTSHHILGCAVDFRAPEFGKPIDIARALATQVDALGIGQLINEFPDSDGWVHVSTRQVANPVNRIITIKKSGTVVGVVA